VQDWDRTGVPPVQLAGDDVTTVRVCVLSDWQVPQPEYVNEVQAEEIDGTEAQACVRTGVPVQLAGDDVNMVLDCVLSDWHAPQVE
jgi:hypothetical protein